MKAGMWRGLDIQEALGDLPQKLQLRAVPRHAGSQKDPLRAEVHSAPVLVNELLQVNLDKGVRSRPDSCFTTPLGIDDFPHVDVAARALELRAIHLA